MELTYREMNGIGSKLVALSLESLRGRNNKMSSFALGDNEIGNRFWLAETRGNCYLFEIERYRCKNYLQVHRAIIMTMYGTTCS